MSYTYWHKQTSEQPLFSDLLWSRPEHKNYAGKLFIVGGNAFGFSAPAEAYASAQSAGVGVTRIVLPQAIKKIVGKIIEQGQYAPSNPSGGFAQLALAEFLEHAIWADATLLAGDFGKNSETVILLEKFLSKYAGQVTLTDDSIDIFNHSSTLILDRPQTTIVASINQLQRLAIATKFPIAFTANLDLIQLVNILHEFTISHQVQIITKQNDSYIVAVGGNISTTPLQGQTKWHIAVAATAATWGLQNPSKPFEALTTSLIAKQQN